MGLFYRDIRRVNAFVLYFVRMMFGVSSIVPNANIDGNDLHDCVK